MSILTAYDKFIQQALKYGFSLWGTAKTGQTTGHYFGDDGTFKKGYPRNGVRFIDNGDGTITDMASGLMWAKDPSQCGVDFGTPGNPAQMNWESAIDACNNLSYAGHTDWRLPNIKELLSILDFGKTPPAIDETFFPNTESDYYWSSTAEFGLVNSKWIIDFSAGWVESQAKTDEYYPRPVRLGVPKT